MDTLIVTAHPDPASLAHQAAQRLQDALGTGRSSVAHLAQEGFDPRFTPNDRERYLGRGTPDPAVTAEQQRLDGAAHVVLAFPVYWWSMPALLKGWIDRVFIAGWAFDIGEEDKVVPALGRLTAHLLPISGTSRESFARHGYLESFSTQIEHGIIDFCGMRRGATAFLHDSESGDRAATTAELDTAVATIAAAITGDETTPGRRSDASNPTADRSAQGPSGTLDA